MFFPQYRGVTQKKRERERELRTKWTTNLLVTN
jgi:hypothetical protein